MPPTLPPGVLHVTDAVVQMLATVTGFATGDGQAPATLPTGKPWLVVERIAGGGPDGDVAMPDGTLWTPYQVIGVGRTRGQAELARDRAHQAILSRSTAGGFTNAIDAYTAQDDAHTVKSLAAADGLVIADRGHDSSGGTYPEGVVFNAVERYALWIVPA